MLRNGMDYATLRHQAILLSPRAHHLYCFFLTSIYPINRRSWLYHHRIGHPSFRSLKIVFPSLFRGLDVESLHCDVREIAKHKCVPFPTSNKKSLVPFYLIHSDTWGPSSVSNISDACWLVSFIDDCTGVSWVFLLNYKSDVSVVLPNFSIPLY